LRRRTALVALGALAVSCDVERRSTSGGPRVVSISPSTTESCFAIGAGALLVGRSRYCDFPPEASRLPVVGGYSDPNLEAIVGLSPSLVVGARGPAGPALEQALNAHGVATFFPETESLAQVEAMLVELGKRLSRERGAAEVIDRIRRTRAAVERGAKGLAPVRALLVFDMAPIVAAGPGGFPDELLRVAGGKNVVTEGGAYPTLNIERLLSLDPHVIIDGAAEMPDRAASVDGGDAGSTGRAARLGALRETPGWRDLRAVREGRFHQLVGSVVLRPGPRIGEGLVAIAGALRAS
jgi:iron complex transport system substrate-binding protein